MFHARSVGSNTSGVENWFAACAMAAIIDAMTVSAPIAMTPRYALVTGAGSGLGRAFCLRLADEGWHVGVTDIDLAAAEQTFALLMAAGGRGQVEHLDASDVFGWHNLLEQLRNDWPKIDLLVNNAGICAAGAIDEVSMEDFQAVLEVNFHGVLHGCQTFVPWLKETAPGGHIINVASIFGLVAPPSMGAYSTSKAAVVALSETLYGELLPHGIGVTVVSPGFFASQLVEQGRFATEQQRQIAKHYMQNARLKVEEVVEQTLTAVRRQQLYVVPGRKARWIWQLKRLLPSRFAKLMAWRYRRKLLQASSDD